MASGSETWPRENVCPFSCMMRAILHASTLLSSFVVQLMAMAFQLVTHALATKAIPRVFGSCAGALPLMRCTTAASAASAWRVESSLHLSLNSYSVETAPFEV